MAAQPDMHSRRAERRLSLGQPFPLFPTPGNQKVDLQVANNSELTIMKSR
jgi:hypothetical protein